MTHSKSKNLSRHRLGAASNEAGRRRIQNPKFSVSSAFLSDLCAFAVQNSSLSLNRRIPNGSWCLFLEPSDGSRNGKVVIVQSRDIQDPDPGGQYTVKIYRSEKAEMEGSWTHRSIRLDPDSMDYNFKPLTLDPDTINDLRVVGEFVGIIS